LRPSLICLQRKESPMNHTRLVRLAATLAVPLSILAGAVIPAHASPGACDMRGCAATIHVNPDLRIHANSDLRVGANPDKVKVLAF
jgi:hypothetical protein